MTFIKSKIFDVDIIKSKMQYWCAYQERCHFQVSQKLNEYDISEIEKDNILISLIEDNYINELRFTKQFVGGKFRIKKWGKHKIKAELKFLDISTTCINEAISEINEEDYLKTIRQVLSTKKQTLSKLAPKLLFQKLLQYALSKGFEQELVFKILNEDK